MNSRRPEIPGRLGFDPSRALGLPGINWLGVVLWQVAFWTSGGSALLNAAGAAAAAEPAASSTAPAVAEITRLEIRPSAFRLTGKRQRLQVVVTGHTSSGESYDLTRSVDYEWDEEQVAVVTATGFVHPQRNGAASLTAAYGELQATLQLEVAEQQRPEAVAFEQQILPLLTKLGCSGGSCHGAPHGKAGFRLSLFSSDPVWDFRSLVRDEQGRRVNRMEPEQSLLLLKPTTQIAHRGGRRMDLDDRNYQLLRDWIAEGCEPGNQNLHCLSLDIYPGSQVVRFPNAEQQLTVQARFSDGSIRDVTRLAHFDTSDRSVATVTREGLLRGVDRGEVAVIVRYLDIVETPLFTLLRDIDGFEWRQAPVVNEVDRLVDAKLRQLQFVPATVCSDEVFLRRVHLDLLGLLPTPDEVRAFAEQGSREKRSHWIDHLLERPEHASFWAQKWGDLLRVSRQLLGNRSVYKLHRWLEHSIATNQPYDAFARELLEAAGSSTLHPAGNYYRAAADTNDAVETTAQLFLGTRIQCAKCHNHPYERWRQDHYYGLASFFHRIQRQSTGRGEEVFLWNAVSGEVLHPHTGESVMPWVPGQGELDLPAEGDRLQVFVDWLTSAKNPFFAHVEVNRIWSQLMGRGIVEPFDDFRDSNPPANAPLLDYLAEEFVRSGFDRRQLLRTILNSRTYQASSVPDPLNRDDTKYFSHYKPRMLTAEQLVDAVGQMTGRTKEFVGVPRGTRATWLPAPDLMPHNRDKIGEIDFLKVFGQPERQSMCACARGTDASLQQALQMFNGGFLHEMLTDQENFFHRATRDGMSSAEIVRNLFLRGLSREPTETELALSIAHVAGAKSQPQAWEDICWALINKREFLFQH